MVEKLDSIRMDLDNRLPLERLSGGGSRTTDDVVVGNMPNFYASLNNQRSASVPPASLPTSDNESNSGESGKNEPMSFWLNMKPIAIEDNSSVVSGSSEFEASPRARLRRDSASSSCSSKQFGRSLRKMRVGQIKRESNVFISEESDYEKEKLIRVASQVATSWEDFSLDDLEGPRQFDESGGSRFRANSLTEPVSIICPNGLTASCSPSPSLSEKKQCFSPAMQQIVPSNFAFSPSPSPTPSPTRRSYLRSLSPIAVRPVTLGLKRKCDSDNECAGSMPKRLNYGGNSSSCASTPDRVIAPLQHPQYLRHSLSVNSLDSESSNSTMSSSDFGLPLLPASNGNGSSVYGHSLTFSTAHIPMADGFSITYSPLSRKSLEDDCPTRLQTESPLLPNPVPIVPLVCSTTVVVGDFLPRTPLPLPPDELMPEVSGADQPVDRRIPCLSAAELFACGDANAASSHSVADGPSEEDTVQSTSDLSTASLDISTDDFDSAGAQLL